MKRAVSLILLALSALSIIGAVLVVAVVNSAGCRLPSNLCIRDGDIGKLCTKLSKPSRGMTKGVVVGCPAPDVKSRSSRFGILKLTYWNYQGDVADCMRTNHKWAASFLGRQVRKIEVGWEFRRPMLPVAMRRGILGRRGPAVLPADEELHCDHRLAVGCGNGASARAREAQKCSLAHYGVLIRQISDVRQDASKIVRTQVNIAVQPPALPLTYLLHSGSNFLRTSCSSCGLCLALSPPSLESSLSGTESRTIIIRHSYRHLLVWRYGLYLFGG